jgi:hypothetical protein
MTIETDLRTAMHERAAPIHAAPDLLAIDYHPRTRRLRTPAAIGGGLATIAGGTVATVVLLAGGASNAFAGWTRMPTAPTAAQVTAANAYCAKDMPTSGLPLKLTDTRGPFTFEVHASDTTNDFCITGPSFTNASGFSTSTPVKVPAGKLFLWAEHTTTNAGQSYGFVIARAGDGVSAATLTLENGTAVTATVQNGWAVAWWPDSHQVTSARLTTPTGAQTQTFPPSSCGLHNCNGSGPHKHGHAGR